MRQVVGRGSTQKKTGLLSNIDKTGCCQNFLRIRYNLDFSGRMAGLVSESDRSILFPISFIMHPKMLKEKSGRAVIVWIWQLVLELKA